jgi:hypothetical protein
MKELYSTDLKYLIPLLGVLVGWLLTSLTGFLKGVTEKQKILSRALTQLHFLYLEQQKVLNHFEYLKDTYGINQEYEKMRHRAMERYVLNNDNFKISLDIVSEVATVYPLTAMNLKGLIENYAFSQKMKLTASSLDSELYLKLLSMFEVGFELEHKHLRKIIFKLAFGHGFITWLQMKWKYYRMDKRVKDLKVHEILGVNEDIKRMFSEKATKPEAEK